MANRDVPKEKFYCMVKTVKQTIFQQICPIFRFARQTLASSGGRKRRSKILNTNDRSLRKQKNFVTTESPCFSRWKWFEQPALFPLTTTIAATSRIASCKKRSMIMAVIWTQFYNRSGRTLLVTMTYVVVQITIYWLVDWYHSTFKITFNCTNSNWTQSVCLDSTLKGNSYL